MIFKRKKPAIKASSTGLFVPIEEVPDDVFAERMLGDGFAIDSVDGKVFSPIEGEIVMIQENKHAIGIKGKEGIELLIHIGIDTLELEGEGFDVKVEVGQQVQPEDLLVDFDKDFVISKGYNPFVIIVVTNQKPLKFLECQQVVAGETTVANY